MMLLVSLAVKSGLASYIIADNGCEQYKKTYRIKDNDILSSPYLCLIDVFKSALRYVKSYVDEHRDVTQVVIESSNQIFMKWLKQGYSCADYQSAFSEVMLSLDDIALSYSVSVNKRPFATVYLAEKYIKKPRVINFDFVNETDENGVQIADEFSDTGIKVEDD